MKRPVVHPGWFQDTLPEGLPPRVAFAYLDSDFFDSIHTSWVRLYPRLSPGAIVLVDDYCDRFRSPRAWDGLPAVKQACDAFLQDKPETVVPVPGCGDLAMAYLRKASAPNGRRPA